MKKSLTFALALALTLSLSVTAFAASTDATINQNYTGADPTTTVQFSITPAYTITIPSTVTLNKDTATGKYKRDATITAAAGVRLLKGQTIKVTLTSGSGFNLTAKDTTTKWPYTVKVGTGTAEIVSGAEVATFTTSAIEQTSTLHFEAENPKFAGDYTDTVTFTIALDPQTTTS